MDERWMISCTRGQQQEVRLAETPFSSRLRFLDADDLDDSTVDFSTLDVYGSDDRDLGDLDGFIVDTLSGRAVYAVVDSGGWFRSRHFAVPIGHAQLDSGRRRLNVNVTRDAAEKFPAFNPGELRRFSDDEMRAFEQRTAIVCCPDDPTDVSGAVQYDRIRHYAQPDWWRREYQREDRYRDLDDWDWRDTTPPASRPDAAIRERERTSDTFNREAVTARASDDVSPHYDGRAQPGDVLGIETGGESTHIGDTPEDEDRTRRRR
jgi:hypothetical protein